MEMNFTVNVRDPYVLTYEGKYYLYGTRSGTAWGRASGFDCYVGNDLQRWDGPFEVFHNDGSFWADRCYWAPECSYYQGNFYLVATFASQTRALGIQILKSDSPLGPFLPHSEGPVTPEDFASLDGTLFFEEGEPWLVFSQSFEEDPRGNMCVMPLTRDLSMSGGAIKVIFRAQEAPWAVPFPYGKEEFGYDHDMYLSDGPALHYTSCGELLMIWSSFGPKGYTVGQSRSESGLIDGKWIHLDTPLFDIDGGHGMLFSDLDGQLTYALHHPNQKGQESPMFIPLREEGDRLVKDK